MHSCGYIYDIMNDLSRGAGISVLQLDQPGLYGVDRLAAEFGGRVTFYCPVDIQRVLPTGDIPPHRNLRPRPGGEARGPHGGGFIAGYYGSVEGIGVKPELAGRRLSCVRGTTRASTGR